MKRTLEPELMDTAEDAVEYDRMDHANVNRIFVDDLVEFSKHCKEQGFDGLGSDILDVGTGTAQIPVELCRRHLAQDWAQDLALLVTAVDDAVSMLDLAIYNIEGGGFRDLITLAKADAKALSFEDNFFDTTISNSLIHHIPEPRSCFSEMHRVTATNGILFARDLLRPDSAEAARQLVDQYAGDESEYCRRLFLDSLCAALTLDEVRQYVVDLGYDQNTVTATSDRHWTWAAIKPDQT